MAGWQGSTRASRLPSDWKQLRERTKARAGGICEWVDPTTGQRCTMPGSECDHIERGDDHRDENLQWLCAHHHGRKTQQEAAQARWRYREKRPAEKHPGLL